MNSKGLAESFISYFCDADIEGIASLLSADFRLKGPLVECASRDEYLSTLANNLEADAEAKILSVIADENKAAAFYIYKGNTIGQFFLCGKQGIDETLLVFDTDALG